MRMIDSAFSIPYHYRAYFTEDVFDLRNRMLGDLLLDVPRVFFVFDEAVLRGFPDLREKIAAYCGKYNLPLEGVLALPGGESCKSMDCVLDLCKAFLEHHLCRKSCVVALGGGAILDAVGLAAALFHRGLSHIRIPTTALSQCDSGVGVKNGVNCFGRKNLLGVFAPPDAVIEDGRFLDTLPAREIRGAAAEAVKVAMIRDRGFFEYLEENAKAVASGDRAKLRILVHRSAELHIRHIADNGDPFETEESRPLDFGHWSAHRMESMSCGAVRHGEAVADGMRLDTKYAVLAGIAKPEVYERLAQVLKDLELPFHADLFARKKSDGTPEIFDGIEEFREHLGGTLHITLPKSVGDKTEVTSLDRSLLTAALDELFAEHGEQ